MAVIMKNSTKKKIADEITKAGLQIKDFEFTPTNEMFFTLVYKPEPDYSYNATIEKILYSPGSGIQKRVKTRYQTWENAMTQLQKWLLNLKTELEISDPWEEIKKLRNDINQIHFNSSQEIFTDSERASMESKIDFLLIEVKKLSLPSAQIISDIAHLKEMTNKISKKDFMLLALGTIAQWVIGNIITPEQSNSVLLLFQAILFSAFFLLPNSDE
jgi:hypothetical protein